MGIRHSQLKTVEATAFVSEAEGDESGYFFLIAAGAAIKRLTEEEFDDEAI